MDMQNSSREDPPNLTITSQPFNLSADIRTFSRELNRRLEVEVSDLEQGCLELPAVFIFCSANKLL